MGTTQYPNNTARWENTGPAMPKSQSNEDMEAREVVIAELFYSIDQMVRNTRQNMSTLCGKREFKSKEVK